MPTPSYTSRNLKQWPVERICELGQEHFQKRTCWYQIKAAQALYAGNHAIRCAATGSGKTLSFWIAPLTAIEDGLDVMTFVVTPLNLLGVQNAKMLKKAGTEAVAISRETASNKLFKDIEDGKYRAAIINPELLMDDARVEKWWKNSAFTARIAYFTFDKAHCIRQWGSFRSAYLNIGALRYLIPQHTPCYIASATLPDALINDLINILHLRRDKIEYLLRSNERPDISLMVRPLVYPAGSFEDLVFLLPNGKREVPPKFLVFFGNKKVAEAATKHLRTYLPWPLKKKVFMPR